MQAILEKEGGAAVKATRPFASPAFASGYLDCSVYRLRDYIENGTLPLAFDIAAPGATRQCLRVATASVLAARAGLKASPDLGKFLDAALPPDKAVYRPPKLAWALHCDYDHIYHLLEAGALEDAGGATRYLIPRDSIIRFLTGRRLK